MPPAPQKEQKMPPVDRVELTTIFANLRAVVAANMAQQGVPGAAVGVRLGDHEFAAGLGVTNVDHPQLVTPDTLFQIGSITKTFVAQLVSKLVEEGKLDLDARVRAYLPDFQVADEDVSAAVTIRHLLTHSAGWVGDFFIDTGEGDDAAARYVAQMRELPQLAPMDSHYSYNNAAFYLLGRLIEVVTGTTFEQAMAELVFAPLGIADAYFQASDVLVHRFAVGHATRDGIPFVATPWALPRAARAAGGIVTNVEMLLRYAKFQMGDGLNQNGDRVLGRASMATMQTAHFPVWGDAEAVALSWFIDNRDGVGVLQHSGGTVGQVSLLAVIPECQFALAIVTNGSQGGHVTRAAYRWCLTHFLGVEPKVPVPLAVARGELAEYEGTFSRPMADLHLHIADDMGTPDDGRLRLEFRHKQGFPDAATPPPPAPAPMTVAPCAPDRLLILDGFTKDSVIDVIRDAAGVVTYLRLGRLYARQHGA